MGSCFMCRLWRVPACIFLLAAALAFRAIAGADWILHDDPDGFLKYDDSEHGSRPSPRTRNVCLCHDFYGDGSPGLSSRWQPRTHVRCPDGRWAWRCGSDCGSGLLWVEVTCAASCRSGDDYRATGCRRRSSAGDDRTSVQQERLKQKTALFFSGSAPRGGSGPKRF